MKARLITLCLLILSTSALAKHTQWYDEAKVINVTPVYQYDYQHNRYDDYSDKKVNVRHNDNHHRTKVVIASNKQHHKRHNKHNRVIGFNVTYKYRGQIFDTFTEHHPGKFISVKLNIEPLFDRNRIVVKQYRDD